MLQLIWASDDCIKCGAALGRWQLPMPPWCAWLRTSTPSHGHGPLTTWTVYRRGTGICVLPVVMRVDLAKSGVNLALAAVRIQPGSGEAPGRSVFSTIRRSLLRWSPTVAGRAPTCSMPGARAFGTGAAHKPWKDAPASEHTSQLSTWAADPAPEVFMHPGMNANISSEVTGRQSLERELVWRRRLRRRSDKLQPVSHGCRDRSFGSSWHRRAGSKHAARTPKGHVAD